MPWIKKGTKMEYYDESGNLIKSYDTNLANGWDAGDIGMDHPLNDGYKTNNFFIRGQVKHVESAIQYFLENQKMPSASDIGVGGGKPYDNVMEDVRKWLSRNGIDEVKYSKDANQFIYSDQGGEKNPDAPKVAPVVNTEASTLNPYTAYLEEQRSKQENAELGLLNETTKANIQNAEISTQQGMIQQAQLKDQLVEQIRSDRLSKMRAGLTPMQIAQEDLQFMVGNMQGNNQNMQMMNQQRLAAQQQKAINPYQAYVNANAAITGGQGYVNAASGFAATDAGDLYQQALRIAQSKGRTAPSNDDFFMAQGQKQG
jgi:hypothetical protein